MKLSPSYERSEIKLFEGVAVPDIFIPIVYDNP
jgi:hypothetical protein